jgi:hypothetical protein
MCSHPRRRTDLRPYEELYYREGYFEEIIMKVLSLLFIGTCGAVLSLSSHAAIDDAAAKKAGAPPSVASHESSPVRTSDAEYATSQVLSPQIVQSQGGTLRPGPHNRHFSAPHGGSVVAGDRGDVPGRE